MGDADLGDARLNARRDRVIEVLEQQPDTGFPDACGSDAETEALYRFLRNRRVSLEAVIEPHLQATADRCRAVGDVLMHDTTENVFTGEQPRPGLTRLGPRRHGFWLHAALAVSAEGLRAPLGVVGIAPFVRQPDRTRVKKPHWRVRFRDPAKESRRWAKGVATVRQRLGTDAHPIHVMDREGDNYELLADLIQQKDRFVVRLITVQIGLDGGVARPRYRGGCPPRVRSGRTGRHGGRASGRDAYWPAGRAPSGAVISGGYRVDRGRHRDAEAPA